MPSDSRKRAFSAAPSAGCIRGIDAGDDDVVILARRERHLAQGLGHAAENLRAKHAAFVINQRHNDRPVLKVGGQRHFGTAGVDKMIVQRELLAQVLVDAGLFEKGRGGLRHGAHRLVR